MKTTITTTSRHGNVTKLSSFLVACFLTVALHVTPVSSFTRQIRVPYCTPPMATATTTHKRSPQLVRRCMLIDPASSFQDYASNRDILDTAITTLQSSTMTALQSSTIVAEATAQNGASLSSSSLATNSDVWVFVAGIIPFGWATIEFWRRIAVGESFGTGSDSIVIIGEDSNPDSSRGRRVLGKDALVVAYILFGIAAAVLGVVLYTVITSDAPPADFSAATSSLVSPTLDVI